MGQMGPNRTKADKTESKWANWDLIGSNRANWTKRGEKEPFRANLG